MSRPVTAYFVYPQLLRHGCSRQKRNETVYFRKAVDVRLKRQRQPLKSVFSREEGAEFAAFTPVVADGFESIAALTETKEIPSDTVLVNQGRRVRNVHLIQRGMVMLVHMDSEGHEVLIGLRSNGWYAGSISVLLNRLSVYSVRTVTPCWTRQISAKDLPAELVHDPKKMRHFTSALCREITSWAAKELTISWGAPDLPDHVMREDAWSDPLRRTVDREPELKHTELAQLLSLSPEHLSKLIHKMHATRAVQKPPCRAHHG